MVKLYRTTGDSLYLKMAQKFIDIRGVTYQPEGEGVMAPSYAQQHLPVREQTKAVGHAVRATYLYAGMADVLAQTGDKSLQPALDSIWNNIVDMRMHITGDWELFMVLKALVQSMYYLIKMLIMKLVPP